MATEAQLRGYLLEEALAWLLRNSGYRLLTDASQDTYELKSSGNGLCVRGRGAKHQVDVLGEFAFTPAFSLPIRLFLEAKFTERPTRLPAARNAHGVIHDINENFVSGGPGQRLRKRYRYVYALFSATGFTRDTQDFALAQQISLIDLSGASFAWLLDLVRETAMQLHGLQDAQRISRFPVRWMRDQLRPLLGTLPDLPPGIWQPTGTSAVEFEQHAGPDLVQFAGRLRQREQAELLLGFPSAPFILPMATSDARRFLAYVEQDPEHRVRIRRTGQGSAGEWAVTPALANDPLSPGGSYELTFELPDHLESWIVQNEEYRVNRARAVKQQLLSNIVIYRMVNEDLRTFQLKYQPSDFRRRRGN